MRYPQTERNAGKWQLSSLAVIAILLLCVSLALVDGNVACLFGSFDAVNSEHLNAADDTILLQERLQVHSMKSKLMGVAGSGHIKPWRQQLRNDLDTQYTGHLTVGGQVLDCIFDTGSFDLIVLSKLCKTCSPHSYRDTRTKYDHETPTYHGSGGLVSVEAYGSGTLFVLKGYEHVEVGPLAANNQSFGEIYNHDMAVLKHSEFEAIAGMGPPGSEVYMSEMREADKALLRNIYRKVHPKHSLPDKLKPASVPHELQKSLLENLGVHRFSVCLGRQRGSPGHLIWNENDPRTVKGFSMLSVVGQIHWGVELHNARIAAKVDHMKGTHGKVFCEHGCGAIIDTGTSLIATPQDVLEAFEDVIAKLDPECNNIGDLPDLVFNLGGVEFRLPPESYVGKFIDDSIPHAVWDVLHFKPVRKECVVLLMKGGGKTQYGPLWIIGMPFFREYYTTFEYVSTGKKGRTIHTAPASADCEPEENPSLLAAHKPKRQPLMIDASKLRVPHWAFDHNGRPRDNVAL